MWHQPGDISKHISVMDPSAWIETFFDIYFLTSQTEVARGGLRWGQREEGPFPKAEDWQGRTGRESRGERLQRARTRAVDWL